MITVGPHTIGFGRILDDPAFADPVPARIEQGVCWLCPSCDALIGTVSTRPATRDTDRFVSGPLVAQLHNSKLRPLIEGGRIEVVCECGTCSWWAP